MKKPGRRNVMAGTERTDRACLSSGPSWLRRRKPCKILKERRLPNSNVVGTTFVARHRHRSGKYLSAVLRSQSRKQPQTLRMNSGDKTRPITNAASCLLSHMRDNSDVGGLKMSICFERLPARFPVGAKYVVESHGLVVRRYVVFPNGRRVQLRRRKALPYENQRSLAPVSDRGNLAHGASNAQPVCNRPRISGKSALLLGPKTYR